MTVTSQPYKTILILGGAYAGRRAAQLVSGNLPKGWRVVVIEKNSHFNHAYVFPRYHVLPVHAPKAFVPVTHAFCPMPGEKMPSVLPGGLTSPDGHGDDPCRIWVRGTVTSLRPNSITYQPINDPDTPSRIIGEAAEGGQRSLAFDYLIYCLGARLPRPVDVWGEVTAMPRTVPGGKRHGIEYMNEQSRTIESKQRIVVVGGGALGIQMASDIKSVYPSKQVTLVHSRDRLMPIYPETFHHTLLSSLEKMGVQVVLRSRLVSPAPASIPSNPAQPVRLELSSGQQLEADLVLLCTGQQPLTSLLSAVSPSSLSPVSGRIMVDDHLRVRSAAFDTSHWYAVGDCAETGSIQAGHIAYYQGQMAAKNVVLSILGREAELETWLPHKKAIKVSMGLKKGICCIDGVVEEQAADGEDLYASVIWVSHGFPKPQYEL